MEPRQEDKTRLESSAGMSWHPLIAETDFPEEGKLATKLGGWFVLVGKTDDGLFAVNDRCTHQASLLSGGRIRRGAVMCPLHGARFEMATGKCIGGTYRDLRSFPLRIEDGMIEVQIPNDLPGMEDLPVLIGPSS
jgi:anthranilate 1,2-dioxygenase ferredoxin component